MPLPVIAVGVLGAGAYLLGRKSRENDLAKSVAAQSKAAAGYGFGGTGRVRGRRAHVGFGAVAAPHPASATPVVATSRSTPQSQLPAPQRTAVINAARPATTRPIVAPTGYIKPPTGQVLPGGTSYIAPPTGQVVGGQFVPAGGQGYGGYSRPAYLPAGRGWTPPYAYGGGGYNAITAKEAGERMALANDLSPTGFAPDQGFDLDGYEDQSFDRPAFEEARYYDRDRARDDRHRHWF